MNGRGRRAKVRKVGMQLWAIVSDKRVRLERRVRRNQNDSLSAAANHAFGEIGHRIDRAAHFDDRLASDFRHHDRRMRGNSGED